MAQKRIEAQDLINPKALESIITDAKKLEAELVKILETNKKLLKNNPFKTGKDVKKLQEQTTAARATESALLKVRKDRIRVENQLKALRGREADELAEVNELKKQQALINRQEAQANTKALGAYKNLSARLNILRRRYKDVATSQGVNSKEARKLAAEVNKLDARLKSVDGSVGQFQRNVGNYTSAFSKMGNALRSVAQAAGATLGIFGAVQVVRNAINVVKDFEKANAVLAGVLGKTRAQVSALTDDAARLGSITEFTASEVTSLQEAYARLGFTQEQILQTTEATLRGATALQAELGDSAELVGATLSQFQLPASDAADVVDVLARSTQISALNFERLQTALPIVGKTANVVGVDIRRTAALLGVLASNGIDASTAGTGLRNIFIELQKKGLSFDEAMAKINNSSNKAATAFELFGKRGVTIAATLADGLPRIDEFEGKLQDVAGTAEKLSKEQLNTLDGALKLLNSAWQGYILQLNDATQGGNALTTGIRFLADNLETILNTVRNVVIAFASYKALSIAIRTVTTLQTAATVAATNAQRGLNIAMKSNPIGLVITGLTALISLLPIFTKEAEASKDELSDFNDELERTEQIRKRLQDISLRIDAIAGLSQQGLKDLKQDIEIELKAISKIEDQAIVDREKVAKNVERLQALIPIQRREIEEETNDFLRKERQKGLEDLIRLIEFEKNRIILVDQEVLDRKKEYRKALDKINSLIVDDAVASTERQVSRQISILDRFVREARDKYKQLSLEIDVSPIEIPEIEDPEGLLFPEEEEVEDEAEMLIKKYRDIKKAQEQLNESIKKGADFAGNFIRGLDQQLKIQEDVRKDALNAEIDRNKERLQAQQRLAERGLANTLAFEEEKAARLEAKREELAQKAERRQKTLAYLTAFTEYLKEDPNSAAGKALAQVALAETISGAFYEGTERVDQDLDKPVFSGRDGYVIRVDGQERVLTGQQNKKIGSLSNDDLADLASAYNQGQVIVKGGAGLSEAGLQRIEKAVRSIDVSVDAEGFITRTEFERSMRKITRSKPKRPRL